MKKIVFVIPNFNPGGSENVLIKLANFFASEGILSVRILTFSGEGPLKEKLSDDVDVIDLQTIGAKKSLFKIVSYIKRERPDCILSSISHVNIVAYYATKIANIDCKLIIRESSIPSIALKNISFLSLYKWLYRKVLNKSYAVVAQSEYMKNDIIDCFRLSNVEVSVINNPICSVTNPVDIGENNKVNDIITLASIGRIEDVKNHVEQIRIIKKLKERGLDIRLKIIGEGSLKPDIKKMIIKFDLEKNIELLGFKSAPFSELTDIDAVIQTSKYEGFPNVLLEAGSYGIPVIAYNSPGGTGEIVNNGVNGFLVEDKNLEQFCELIESKICRNINKGKIINHIKSKYMINHIASKYMDLISL